MKNILTVFIGGGFGSLARYGIAGTLGVLFARLKFNFPIATLASNLLSCTLLAITVSIVSSKADISPTWRILVITGFCGGFSTFSAFSYETVDLLRNGFFWTAFANIAFSISACLTIIYLIIKN